MNVLSSMRAEGWLLGLVCLFMLQAKPASSQIISSGGNVGDAFWMYEVKMIDEFIERFNDDPASNLRRVYREHKRPVNFTRTQLLASLFESREMLQNAFVRRFILKMADSVNPFYLSFHDTGWYAEVQCRFNSNKQAYNIPLILQIVKPLGAKGYKWMITGIGESPVFRQASNNIAALDSSHVAGSIPAANNGLDFMALQRILTPGLKAPSNYFTPELLDSERGKKFVQLISEGKLTFGQTGEIRFHFFQIPEYVMTVGRYLRNTNHSGWLISSISNATQSEKLLQKEKLLQRKL